MATFKYDPATGTYTLVDDTQLIADPTLANLSVATDQMDYAPGSTAEITVSGFSSGDTVEITAQVVEADGTLDAITFDTILTVDGNGTGLTTMWIDPTLYTNQTILLTATDLTAGVMTTEIFTDATPPVPTDFGYVDAHIDLATTNATTLSDAGAIWANSGTALVPGKTSGTGTYSTFSEVQTSSGSEQGFNTSANGVLDEKYSDVHNHQLHLTNLVAVYDDGSVVGSGTPTGTTYYEFKLDLHQSGSKPYLSLDGLQIWQSHTDNLGLNTYTATPDTDGSQPSTAPSFSFNAGVATQIYDLGAHSVLLNASFAAGSGGGSDVIVLIPTADFDPSLGNAIYLYSAFGNQGADWQANSTFEEWGALTGTNSTPNPTAILSGFKYNDLNTNGVLDPATDLPLQGWTIDLYKDNDNSGTLTAADTLFASTSTDASGAYQFGDLVTGIAAGNYIIVEENQAGWTETPDIHTTLVNAAFNAGDAEHGYAVTVLATDTTRTGFNFANHESNFSASGQKFEDLTGDGKTADDQGWTYGPVTIFIDEDNSGTLTAGDKSTTTDATGHWSIGGLTLSDVGKIIYEVVPSGSEQTGVLVQTVDNPGGGGTDTGNDFTNFRNFTVSGQKFEDLTGNGKTADDQGWTYGPVTVFIDEDNSGDLSAGDKSTTTDATGHWSIGGLTLSDVGKSIYEVVPSGSEQTGVLVQTVDNPGSGGTDTGNDFTNFRNFTVSGQKFEDLTGNGKTADDQGWTYGPVTVFIDEDNSGDLSAGDKSTTTDATGHWSIGGLTLSDVGKSIYEVVPSGSEQTGVLVQTVDNPGSGGTDTGNDFTNFRNFTVSGQKFEDLTGNGKTADDQGWTYGPVTVFIDEDNSGDLSAGDKSTTTDATGHWSIGGLTLSDVGKSIYEVVPSGSEQTGVLVQTVDNPGSGGTDTGNDFTNFRNFTVSGQKFEDLTGNGKTADDQGWTYGPVTVFIDEDNSGDLSAGDKSTTTDATGHWSIGGLTLSDVGKSIYEVVPSGSQQTGVLVQTVDNPGSGGTDTGNDFTNFRNFTVSGQKFEDLTGNGKTADDQGWTYGTVTVFIDEDNSGDLSAGDKSTTT
ncbi:hypothetical protein QY049_11355, partial [Bradyrhizobium sp. WYCCWR 13022]